LNEREIDDPGDETQNDILEIARPSA
jgi:hypothetical protein